MRCSVRAPVSPLMEWGLEKRRNVRQSGRCGEEAYGLGGL